MEELKKSNLGAQETAPHTEAVLNAEPTTLIEMRTDAEIAAAVAAESAQAAGLQVALGELPGHPQAFDQPIVPQSKPAAPRSIVESIVVDVTTQTLDASDVEAHVGANVAPEQLAA